MQLKLQSAMEYLMTYGWAILIIAVVLAALFQLGVFNPNTFAPKVPPGSCQVIRPKGPMSTDNINLAGTCNNQLPQYVAQFSSASSSNIIIQNAAITSTSGPVTMVAWGKMSTSTAGETLATLATGSYNCATPNGLVMYVDGAHTYREGLICSEQVTGLSISTNTWFFSAVTYNGVAQNNYIGINGKIYALTPQTKAMSIAVNPNLIIGKDWNPSWDGQISNVQLYNTSLSQNDITALYQEGIGGAPIDLFHLVGWWPLNGNTNDYSGNLNNGVATNVLYSGAWSSTYSPT